MNGFLRQKTFLGKTKEVAVTSVHINILWSEVLMSGWRWLVGCVGGRNRYWMSVVGWKGIDVRRP